MAGIYSQQVCTDCECITCPNEAGRAGKHEIFAWMLIHHILPEGRICVNCNVPMSRTGDDRFKCGKTIFDANQQRKRRCNTNVSLFKGSFFEESRLKMKKIFIFTVDWLHARYPRQKYIMKNLKMSSATVVDWSNFCREVCFQYLLERNVRIGGPGHVVEINEAKIGKRKYNRGKVIDGKWIFSGIDRDTKETFIVPVPSRGADVVIPLVQEYVEPGTTIMIDQWAAYNSKGTYVYQHLTVNHSVNFVDPATGAHTQRVERLWHDVRGDIPLFFNKTPHRHYHIAEFLFKRKFKDGELLHKFWSEAVKELYPCS